MDSSYTPRPDRSVIYLAGGCFWGLEKAFSVIRGVTDTECGYANGYDKLVPDYLLVCSGRFGYLETVRVEFDPKITDVDRLLMAFFLVIDPTEKDHQGNDIGKQYNTGVFWTDEAIGAKVREFFEMESAKYPCFYTECKELENFFPAEEEHQEYLDKNPGGYCHIPESKIRLLKMF